MTAVRLCCATFALRFLWYFTYLKFLDSLEGRVEREAGVIRFPFLAAKKRTWVLIEQLTILSLCEIIQSKVASRSCFS